MLVNNRVIFSDNGTLRDLSAALNDLFASNETLDVVAAQDKLYFGSDLPFNHRHIQVSTANDQAATISEIAIWNGSEWVPAVDVIDRTKVNGVTLAQSGIVSWVTDRNEGWTKEDTTEDIAALASAKVYDLYWVRVTFSANLKTTTALSYVGHKFSNDAQLAGYYPDLNRQAVKTAFSSASKTTWDDQHVLAAEEIIRDLRVLDIIKSPAQIANWEIFQEASVHKVAEIIVTAFGEKYEENRKLARERYDEAMQGLAIRPAIDANADGRLDTGEKFASRSWVRG
jgi:hypothetical protein